VPRAGHVPQADEDPGARLGHEGGAPAHPARPVHPAVGGRRAPGARVVYRRTEAEGATRLVHRRTARPLPHRWVSRATSEPAEARARFRAAGAPHGEKAANLVQMHEIRRQSGGDSWFVSSRSPSRRVLDGGESAPAARRSLPMAPIGGRWIGRQVGTQRLRGARESAPDARIQACRPPKWGPEWARSSPALTRRAASARPRQ
jgi:hypothetical protein